MIYNSFALSFVMFYDYTSVRLCRKNSTFIQNENKIFEFVWLLLRREQDYSLLLPQISKPNHHEKKQTIPVSHDYLLNRIVQHTVTPWKWG